jgi:isoleucyl-tRNA synthetase
MANTGGQQRFKEFGKLNLPEIDARVGAYWKEHDTFARSTADREEAPSFVFYEGPPSANGAPGIHHVISRTIKDLFCRYKTMKGFKVERKGGWDTHGLPVELGVEKLLGITKEDIGKKISIEEYNAICRREVMKYKDQWDELTRIMGYWVDLDHPYITFENNYIETLWHLLSELHKKGLLYKGYSIQPFSPAAGTGLSSHELNMPGSYRNVKDTTLVAQFRVLPEGKGQSLYEGASTDVFFLAWTTTPWTLPSNTALAVGKKIIYVQVQTLNPYTGDEVSVILAKDLLYNFFKEEQKDQPLAQHEGWNKHLPWTLTRELTGSDLEGVRYEQLIPYAQPETGDAFVVVTADFVSTEDGTGIVHIAPSFGADDYRTAQLNGIGYLTLVDRQGRFTEQAGKMAGRYVKNYTDDPDWENPDIDIAVELKSTNRAFRVEKHEHNYPHCWRTDKPVIYYPLDSWFIRTTAVKEKLLSLNAQINWKPRSTGEGRFAQWLQNLVDWNLSRSRYWGTPLPIWRTENGEEEICIGSVEELTRHYLHAREQGYNKDTNLKVIDNRLQIDLHRPVVDDIVLVSGSGKPMYREADLIDVWFDSGAMPYAQWHYPFENKDRFEASFPADFIAEGVDQTRGWFFTLHVIACMLFDSVAYKNVVSNGLVLDKSGNKMSKRLGNTVNPFDTIYEYGADATRWYMITNAQPWDNLKFDIEGLKEVQRKFFGTLFNTYSFFALYANVDGFDPSSDPVPFKDRPELDRWILSRLQSLVKKVDHSFEKYEPTQAGREIEEFVTEQLSNWYVRLSRRRFWKGEFSEDKLSAYQTLYTCLDTIASLMAPISPFFAEFLYGNLHQEARAGGESVHVTTFPLVKEEWIDTELEEQMQLAQEISSTILSLRKKENIKVRQPLLKAMVPVLSDKTRQQIAHVAELIKAEVNIKELEFIDDSSGVVTRKLKPNFKKLGPLLGPKMKMASSRLMQMEQQEIMDLERTGKVELDLYGEVFTIDLDMVEVVTEDIPGWLVGKAGNLTVALDVHISDELKMEGDARELVSKLQKMRKDIDLSITDKVMVDMQVPQVLEQTILTNKTYICTEILATDIRLKEELPQGVEIDINEEMVRVQMNKM